MAVEKATVLERLSRGQRSLASFFELLAEALIRQAERLDATVGDLDRRFPNGRRSRSPTVTSSRSA